MKTSQILDENVLVQRGVDVLMKELGPINARRFIAMTVNKRTNSIKRHRAWQNQLDKTVFFDAVFS
ncbi:MAG: hypothetical protein ABR497_10095, partial [Kiritimatiellia bacterium]